MLKAVEVRTSNLPSQQPDLVMQHDLLETQKGHSRQQEGRLAQQLALYSRAG